MNIKHKIKIMLEKLGVLLLVFKFYEKIKSINLRDKLMVENEIPLPPPYLRVLVAGDSSSKWFLDIGKRGANNIKEVLDKNGIDIKNLKNILDFGCGCGRVLRHLNYLQNKKVNLFGSDYNNKLIDWCQKNIKFANFKINNLNPPLNFESEKFDLVYALSVFTHLDAPMQIKWIKEMRRIIKKGGYLFITTQGKYYFNKLTLVEKEWFNCGDIVIKYAGAAGSNLCSAYHPLEYINGNFSEGFKLVDFIEKGALGNPFQDVVLFKRIG